MAELIPHPDLVGPVPANKREEYKTASWLAQALPPTYKVFHSVHWATQNCDKTFLGEIDFIVLSPLGRLLLIEQKNGGLQEGQQGLTKLYSNKPKSVLVQMNRSLENLLTAFEARSDERNHEQLDIDMLVYCPDYVVQNKAAAGIPVNRIVDQHNAIVLPNVILDIFQERPPHKGACQDINLISDFLSSNLRIRYDIGFLGQLAKSAYIEQGAGLSEWVSKMHGVPFRLLINATAGSGKTQLALDEVRTAYQNGLSALYVCFNRNLAVDMKTATGQASACTTFHEMARVVYESKGFLYQAGTSAFQASVDYFLDHAEELAGSFDVLVIDEAQDFEAGWLEALFKLCKPEGRLIALMDHNQRLYEREPFDFKGWVHIDHQVSNRCPRVVTDIINQLELVEEPIGSRSAVEGLDTLLETYTAGDSTSLAHATSAVVDQLLKEGHTSDEIVVLSLRGAESSALLKLDELAAHPLKKIVGRTAEGDFIFSAGALVVDTVFRFKGRSANCVVLSEIDFDELTENTKRRLFVGMTRARLRLALVCTEEAAEVLSQKVNE